jgi:shikimate kinase
MATGKSSVGRLLAARLGYEWVDTDAIIESRHGSVEEIFGSHGEETFRRLEQDVAVELAKRRGLVISTGGRMMLDPRIEGVLSLGSRVFCLTAEPEEIGRRVKAEADNGRPLLAGADVGEQIRTLLAERSTAYARFEQVPTDARSVDDVVNDIVRRLGG